jgi:hypothetical protein
MALVNPSTRPALRGIIMRRVHAASGDVLDPVELHADPLARPASVWPRRSSTRKCDSDPP